MTMVHPQPISLPRQTGTTSRSDSTGTSVATQEEGDDRKQQQQQQQQHDDEIRKADDTKDNHNNNNSNNNNNNNNDPYRLQRKHFNNFTSPKACLEANRCVAHCAAYGRVCLYAARRAAASATQHVELMFQDSVLFGGDGVEFEHYIEEDEIKFGEKLGSGGFCDVFACDIPSWNKNNNSSRQEFAAKKLRRQCMCDPSQFRHGAADLAIEAHILQALNHNHIVKVHGVPKDTATLATKPFTDDDLESGQTFGFFLIIDRLYDTLDKRIEQWAHDQEKHHGNLITRWTQEFREYKRVELVERLRAAFAIADAMEYLHKNNIVYRDLKPDNIGFDKDGVIKLFDFGLAKEMKANQADDNGQYVMSGNTGSRRYMACEVILAKPYNQMVDVYSFGILLWEMCSAEKPFAGYSSAKHMQNVVLNGERPPMDSRHIMFWPVNLQWLITKCWSNDPNERPSFTVIKETIREILLEKKPDTAAGTAEGGRPRLNSHNDERTLEKTTKQHAQQQQQHHPHHGLASLFHRKPVARVNSNDHVLPPRPLSHPTQPQQEREGEAHTAPSVPPPGAALLSNITPVATQTGRAKSWGFGMWKKGTSTPTT
jgi:serine/threonine protein kinase